MSSPHYLEELVLPYLCSPLPGVYLCSSTTSTQQQINLEMPSYNVNTKCRAVILYVFFICRMYMMLKFDIFECLQINYFAYVHINIFSSVSHCLHFSLSEIICFIWSITVYSSQRTEMFPRADHMTLSCAIIEVALLLVSYSTMPHLHISQYF